MSAEELQTNTAESVERLELSSLREGDLVFFRTGDGEDAYLYEMLVQDRGEHPLASIAVTNPTGDEATSMARIVGCGRWTTQSENPVQRQFGKTMTIAHGSLFVGGKLILDIENQGRITIRDDCAEISTIYADHSGKYATEADIRLLEQDLIERLQGERRVLFNKSGLCNFSSKDMKQIWYQAACEGYGFPVGFTPECHNWLWDDVTENEVTRYLQLLDEVDRDTSGLYWRHSVDRSGLEQLIHYWYQHGHYTQLSGFGFPWWSGEGSAVAYYSMSPSEREAFEEAAMAS